MATSESGKALDGLKEEVSPVVLSFKRYLQEEPDISLPVAAIKALTEAIKHSEAATMMGLEIELRFATDLLKQAGNELKHSNRHGKTIISLTAGCELFMRYVTRTLTLDSADFEYCKKSLIERGETFTVLTRRSRAHIAELGERFIRDGLVVLTHGHSKVVKQVLLQAAKNSKNFSVIITEGRPDCAGYLVAQEFIAAGIPTTLVLDSAVGYVMENVDVVLVGAEGVVENGGVINKIGTYQLSIVAAAFKKPFYVAAESFKFFRMYPLRQSDVPEARNEQQRFRPVTDGLAQLPEGIQVDNPTCDYTPPAYITLLFTDLGIFTPSAVSDELIKLYY
eukprot:GILK01002048.1.p1 GENE.GILK01002048.1~~GILK01002048.1.p1  ORF type:complete len:355 (+),score=52.83 GILK01002048.1:58-1065(+)